MTYLYCLIIKEWRLERRHPIIADKDEKKLLFNQLMIHKTGKSFDFTDKMVATSFILN